MPTSSSRPPPTTRKTTNAIHFTTIPRPLQKVRWRAWLRTADANASERPWNHSRSVRGRSLTVSATCESAAGPSSVRRSKIAATGFSTGEQLDALVAAREVDVVDLLVAQAQRTTTPRA